MTTKLIDTQINKKYITVLKTINECKWSGSTSFSDLESALVSANLQTGNSGLYVPVPIRVKGLKGIRFINENGNINFEIRILKESNEKYVIEYLTNSGYNDFEHGYKNISN